MEVIDVRSPEVGIEGLVGRRDPKRVVFVSRSDGTTYAWFKVERCRMVGMPGPLPHYTGATPISMLRVEPDARGCAALNALTDRLARVVARDVPDALPDAVDPLCAERRRSFDKALCAASLALVCFSEPDDVPILRTSDGTRIPVSELRRGDLVTVIFEVQLYQAEGKRAGWKATAVQLQWVDRPVRRRGGERLF